MANSSSIIRISAKPKKALPVDLIGITYSIKPPKTSLLLAISDHAEKKGETPGALSRDFDTILKLMFSPKKGQYEEIKARLGSADDELDLEHIFESVEAVTEAQTGNPTS